MRRPFVYVNMAMTADGKITSSSREYPRFTSAYDRENMDRLRAGADALLVGAGTLRADDPELHVRSAEMRAHRRRLGKTRGLDKVVVSSRLDIPENANFFDDRHGGDRIVATVLDAPAAAVESLRARCEVWQVGHGSVDLEELLDRLTRRGIERLLVEGGGELNWHFVRQDVVDELYLTVAPCLLGGREAPTLLEGEGLPMEARRRLKLLEMHREGDELYLRYAVVPGRAPRRGP